MKQAAPVDRALRCPFCRANFYAGEVMRQLVEGSLGARIKHVGLAPFTESLERSSNRVAFSLVIAALFVGSAILVASEVGPTLWGHKGS